MIVRHHLRPPVAAHIWVPLRVTQNVLKVWRCDLVPTHFFGDSVGE